MLEQQRSKCTSIDKVWTYHFPGDQNRAEDHYHYMKYEYEEEAYSHDEEGQHVLEA